MNCYKFLTFKQFCYNNNFKYINKNTSSSVDKIFILTLDTSKMRYKHIYQEIIKNDLYNTIIVVNTPYTRCKKTKNIKNSLNDILDANLQIYKYCLTNSLKNVLILEDDFEFDRKPNFNLISNIIKKNKPDVLYLGHLPFFILDRYENFNRVISLYGHSYIINNNAMKKILSSKRLINRFNCLDEILAYKALNFSLRCYALKPQICFQKDFIDKRSNNTNSWDKFITNIPRNKLINLWEPLIDSFSFFIKYIIFFIIIFVIYKYIK